MGKSKSIVTNNEELPKKRGRQAGAKTYNQQTLYKLVDQYRPRNMVLWGTVAEQYRVQCGELKPRDPSALKKHFIHKMCYGMKKPTGSSGIDDFTAKCQTLNRALFSIEEANTFGDSDEEDEFSRLGGDVSDDDSSEATALEVLESTQTSLNTPTAAADLSHTLHHQIMTGSSDSVSRPIRVALDGHPPDSKSKNAKPNPKTRLNVGKFYNYYISIFNHKQFL
jgi:hypothetical protein